MTPREFHLNPADYGLPTRDELVDLRIWDSHFHAFYGAASDPVAQYRANNFYVERMGIERSISLEIGGTLANPLTPAPFDDALRAILESAMLDIMYDIPSRAGVKEIVVSEETILKKEPPLVVYAKEAEVG